MPTGVVAWRAISRRRGIGATNSTGRNDAVTCRNKSIPFSLAASCSFSSLPTKPQQPIQDGERGAAGRGAPHTAPAFLA